MLITAANNARRLFPPAVAAADALRWTGAVPGFR